MDRHQKVRLALGWGVALVLLVGAVVYVWQPFATRRADRVAGGFLRAVFEGDGQRFYEFIHPLDQSALELTPEKCQRLLNEVVLPKFQGCKVVEWARPRMGGEGYGYAWVELECGGKRSQFGMNAGEVTGVGGTVGLNLFLQFVWDWEFYHRYGRWSSGYLESSIEGVKRDMEKLEAIGIKGWSVWKDKGYVLPWREWLADAERRFKEQRERSARVR
jgi:hypothetical protein